MRLWVFLLLVALSAVAGAASAQTPTASTAGPAPAAPTGAPASAPDHESAPASPERTEQGPPIHSVRILGKLAKGDTIDRVRAFLDLRPPTTWGDQLQSRVRHDLESLGYRADIALEDGILSITVTPVRTVRRIYVSGNWPIFEWEILSFLTWRTGYRLPEGEALFEDIRRQERELVSFLNRSGYYDATAEFRLDWAPASPEQVDVRVKISLNVGFWRLRYNIGEVRAEGVSLLSHRELVDFFDHCCLWFGRTSTEKINEDFKRLLDYYQGKGYAGARILRREIQPDPKRRRVNINIELEEKKRIVLSFVGNKAVSDSVLRSATTIFQNNYYSATELDESARNMYRVYQQRGFLEARVRWRWKKQGGDPLEVEFLVHEGPQLKVREIEFVPGAADKQLSFPTSRLAEQTRTRVYPRLGLIGLGEGGYASAVQIAQDVQKLTEFYRREGFPEARVYASVTRSRAALDNLALFGAQTVLGEEADAGDLFVRFSIDEGRRELVEAVEVQIIGTETKLTEAQVRKVLQLKPGSAYTPERGAAEKQRLIELLENNGHPFDAIIDSLKSTWNADHTRVTLRWILTPGEIVRFGPILIRGNTVTRENVIRRDLPFKPGDVYDGRKILEGQQNLNSRQIFSSVRVIPRPGISDEYRYEAMEKGWSLSRNPVPILVEVIERYDNSGEIALYVGVSTDNPVYSTASYTWRNMLGTGAEVELRGELGVRIQSLLARTALPRLGSPFLRLDLRGFWRNELTYTIGQVTSYGANAELSRFFARTDDQGRRLPPSLRLFGRVEFNISQIVLPLSRVEGTTDVGQIGDSTQSLKVALGVVWDKRVGFEAPGLRLSNRPVPPNPLMPVSGFRLSAQATVAMCCTFDPPSANGSFLALEGQAIWLRPFGPELKTEDGWPYGMKRFNFKLNWRLNYGYPFFTQALPVVEQFFAGGDTTTRGYDTGALKAGEQLSPVGPLRGDNIAYRIVPQGGNIRFLSQLEWEFAITPRIAGWPWVGAVFLDTGAVFDRFERLTWNDVRFSLGVSVLRLLTQFGALSLDYAYPLTLPGQDALLQSDRWKREPWYSHFPGRIHFNWGMPISF